MLMSNLGGFEGKSKFYPFKHINIHITWLFLYFKRVFEKIYFKFLFFVFLYIFDVLI
jgi:hypothetical protein